MKALNSIILIFLTVQLLGQGISHYQLDEPEIGTSDSVLFFVKTGDYWSMVKGVMDTSRLVDITEITFVDTILTDINISLLIK